MERIRNLWRRNRVEKEIAEEARTHIEMRTEDNIASGMRPAQARHDAKLRFGNVRLVEERTREMDLMTWIETAGQDLRFAWRMLVKSPGFTAIAVMTLALGIGANTAMFTVVESVLVRPLPYTHPERLVYIKPAGAPGFGSTSWLNFRDIRDETQRMEMVAGYSEDVGVVQGKEGSVSVNTPRLTPNIFDMLGAKALVGRTFSEEEGKTGGPQVVILSEGLWRESFNGDPNIVGQTVRVNGQARVVVGVMPRSFRFPESTGNDITKALWFPLQPTEEMEKVRGYDFFNILGRLKPGATVAQERSELGMIAHHIGEIDPKEGADLKLDATRYQEMITGPVSEVFMGLVIALGLVLLIACANVANLMIARCLARQQEFAIRAAMGAGAWRLIRQLIVEGLLLSSLGCAVGFGLACAGVWSVHQLPVDTIPRGNDIAVRWTVVLMLGLIAVVTTILSAILPALLASKTDPQKALQSATRGAGGRSLKRRMSGWLVAGEVALSALLLIATGLLFHTLWNLEHTRLGFDTTRVTMFMGMPADAAGFGNIGVTQENAKAPASVVALVYQPALERIRNTPGVQDAALVTSPPLAGMNLGSSFKIVGYPNDAAHKYQARVTAVSGEYERVMGTPVIRGRMVNDNDTIAMPFVVTVNEMLARKVFGEKDPLGQQIDLGGKDTGMMKPYTIVGVIGDQVDQSVSTPPQPYILLPYGQVPTTSLYYPALLKTIVNFVVKTRGNMEVAPAMRNIFKQVAPDFALDNFRTMQEAVDSSNFSQRLGLYLIGGFAGLAILMVVAGLYGVLAQLVSYRRREIGLRLALGATPGTILRMVVRQGLAYVGAGLAVGIAVGLFAGRLVESFLYEVKPADAWTYAGVVIVLMVVGSVAALAPAMRAAGVEPMKVLREE
ncbi:MAG TPA: ABC transporter permease [Candidatus Acidoferrales bacterium]|nr:ABC transporter permease [Candidatus Acidoferrales bacterium]